MKALTFKVNLTSAFTDNQLIKSGWEVQEKDKLYTRLKDKYKYSYVIKSYGKIRISEMNCELYNDEKLSYIDMTEFVFEDGWKHLWNRSFVPESVEIILKENLFEQLVLNGWKPAVLGVIENVSEEFNLSYYYPAPEGENLYKIVDDNPGDVLKFIDKLKGIIFF